VCSPAFNDAPSYRAAEAPIDREVQREVLSTMVPDEIERGDTVVIAGDSFAIDDARAHLRSAGSGKLSATAALNFFRSIVTFSRGSRPEFA
jgi:hypothetical protein